MDIAQALILSLVEGVSEFLPISSTGHMVLISGLIGVTQSEFVKSFEIFIQLGAIMGVVVLYYKKLFSGMKMWKSLIIALLPTVVVGLIFYNMIKSVLIGNVMVTVLALGIGGIVMIALEKYYFSVKKQKNTSLVTELGWKKTLLIGVGQSISVIPGVSRAAATIFSGMLVGLNREAAVEFSFLLAVPTMMAASGLDLFKSRLNFSVSEIGILAVGFGGAFLTSIVVIRWLVKFVSRNNFIGFGIYRVVFSLFYWIMLVR